MGRKPVPWKRTLDQTWYVTIRGERYKLGKDKDEAKTKFHAMMAKPHQPVSKITVAVVINNFLAWVQLHKEPGTYGWYQRHLKSFYKHVGRKLMVRELKPAHVTAWITKRFTGQSPSTIHGAMRTVQRAMKWAAEEGHIAESPIALMKKPKPRRRELTITPEQFDEVLALATDAAERDMLTTLWDTGCRIQELRRVEARHFEEKERRWVFPPSESKGKEVSRVVYLPDRAFEITQRLAKQHKTGQIYRNGAGEPWTKNAIILRFRKLDRHVEHPCDFCEGQAFARLRVQYRTKKERLEKKKHICRACVDARGLGEWQYIKFPPYIKGLCATSIRHSFCTNALMSGVDPITVSVLLGHANLQMVANTYSHLSRKPDFLLGQLKKLSRPDEKV